MNFLKRFIGGQGKPTQSPPAEDNDGGTALINASAGGHLGVVKVLLRKGTDVNATTSDGTTALDVAEQGKRSALMALLLKAVYRAAVLAMVLCVGCGSDDTVSNSSVHPRGFNCSPVTVAIQDGPVVANPFDQAQADVTVEFTGPNGVRRNTPAFFTQDFERVLTHGIEHLTPTGPPGWRARFTPRSPGAWQWQARIQTNGGTPQTAAGSFSCDSEPASHGVLRRSSKDNRYVVWEDGTPFIAVGENLGWYDQRGTFDYDDWLDKLAAHGTTWIRIWMPSWAFGLEWIERGADGAVTESSLGNYTARLDRAWQLDHVIEAARQRHFVVLLSLQNHGAFSLTTNPEWADNPYNAANGGPLQAPREFFTDPMARELFRRRLRYIIARWGYATNVIWELWNEVDNADRNSIAEVVAWHAEMADAVRVLDPYGHLITTSLSGTSTLSTSGGWAPLWQLPEMDLTQWHGYGVGNVIPLDFRLLVPKLERMSTQYAKPVLLEEAGVDFRGPAETLAADSTFQGLHELIWSGLFAGASGSGMTWWWDNLIDPYDQYHQLDGIVALGGDIAWEREGFLLDGAEVTAADGASLQVFPLRGAATVLAWVRNAKDWWNQPDRSMISAAGLLITGLADGRWRVRWLDTHSGAVKADDNVAVVATRVQLQIPPFSQDIALRMELETAN